MRSSSRNACYLERFYNFSYFIYPNSSNLDALNKFKEFLQIGDDKIEYRDEKGKVSNTSSNIVSKSISRGGGHTSYRGLLHVAQQAKNSKAKVRCDALLLDPESRSDTYPTNDVRTSDVQIEHEAVVSKIGDEQLFYLRSRGLSELDATSLIVSGFIEPIAKELPMEYAVELNRLIQLEMDGSVG